MNIKEFLDGLEGELNSECIREQIKRGLSEIPYNKHSTIKISHVEYDDRTRTLDIFTEFITEPTHMTINIKY